MTGVQTCALPIFTNLTNNVNFNNDITEATLTATTKTQDSGFTNYHWDITNNRLYEADKTWRFGIDGTLSVPAAGIRFPGGSSIKEDTVVTQIPGVGSVTRQDLIIDAERDVVINVSEDTYQFKFRENGGVQFADGTTQYGAYIADESFIDGGSAITVFPVNLTTPRAVDGGGSGSRFGNYDPGYDGGTNGAGEQTMILIY